MTVEYVITYYGEDVDGADTIEDARKQMRAIWQAVISGSSGYWDAGDFDGYDENADGTGFLDAVKIVKRTYGE
jgi:hypothetical protein